MNNRNLNKLHSLYKYSLLFEGKFENNKIIYSKYKSICIKLVFFIYYIVILSHLIIFLTDQNIFKDHLVYFKLSENYGSRILNLAGGYVVFVLGVPLFVYRKYSQTLNNYLPFNFLFCFDKNEMHEKYHLSIKRSEQQVKLHCILLKYSEILFYHYSIIFTLLFGNNFYQIVKKTSFDQPYLNYFVNSIKIIDYIYFIIFFYVTVLEFFLITNEAILSFKYLSNRLDDQIDEIMKLFLNLEINNKRKLSKKMNKIIKNYNSIIRDKKMFNKHFDKVLNYSTALLLMTILYKSILLNGPNDSKFLIYFYSTNLILTYVCFAFYCVINYICQNSNRKFLQNLNSLVKYRDYRISRKILDIHTLNNHSDICSFNYRGFFQYTFRFLLNFAIENTSIQFLVYQANQFKINQNFN